MSRALQVSVDVGLRVEVMNGEAAAEVRGLGGFELRFLEPGFELGGPFADEGGGRRNLGCEEGYQTEFGFSYVHKSKVETILLQPHGFILH